MSPIREPIFDDTERVDTDPADHSESTFEFMNRVSGSYWDHPRALMQAWADRVREVSEYHDLRQRLRSRDDEQFRSAFLELYLHECLRRAGYRITIHPPVPGTNRRPDFLAERNNQRLFVEAVAPGATPAAKAAAHRRAVLFDTVNRLGDPNFMLWLHELEEGSAPPAAAKLRAALRRWLAALDPDTITDLEHTPLFHWRDGDWSATFRPIPKRSEARTVRPNDRAIGVYGHTRAGIIDDAPAIRNALGSKDRAYGDLGAPFLVALGTYIFDTDRWHSTNALYGQSTVQIGETPVGTTVSVPIRQPDGYFGAPPNWRNRNVSGVLLVNQLQPYFVHKAETVLWRHPDPLHPLPDDLGFPCLQIALHDGQLAEIAPAVPAGKFLGLPDPWPPGSPWPND